MTDNTLSKAQNPVTKSHWDQFFNAMVNDQVGRNGLGEPEAGKKSGTAAVPWGEVHTGALFLNGSFFDPSNIGSSGNGVISGQTRSSSVLPDFIRADGAAASFQVLGATVPLSLNIAGNGVTVNSDLTLGGLSAAPATNNTATINDNTLTGDSSSKYRGEGGSEIILDAVGSEITDRVGQYAAFKNGATEIFLARIKSADDIASTAVLDNVTRGHYFDSTGAAIIRQPLSNNDVITFCRLAWVFLQTDGTTLDVTYSTPVWSNAEPDAPDLDDYWFDLQNEIWKRYDGSEWEVINRNLIGQVVMDTSNCIASRSIDFSRAYSDVISIETESFTDTTITSQGQSEKISVYGNDIEFGDSSVVWDITQHLESGLIATTDTLYYLYLTEKGSPVISEERPNDRRSDLKGLYHPYHSWRFVGLARTDGDTDFEFISSNNTDTKEIVVFNSLINSVFYPIPFSKVKVTVTGGGGGSTGGGTSGSFGDYMSATGGSSGSSGNGGSASGGDFNISGGRGGATEAGTGGASYWGGGGRGGNGGVGTTGEAWGSGGGGGDNNGGGGAGGTAIKTITMTQDAVSVTRGSGGGNSTASNRGGDGVNGICVIEYLRGAH